jgi:type III secretory pathway component EscT
MVISLFLGFLLRFSVKLNVFVHGVAITEKKMNDFLNERKHDVP